MYHNELDERTPGGRIARRLLGYPPVQSQPRELELPGAALQRQLSGGEIREQVVTDQSPLDNRAIQLQPPGSGGDITGPDGELRNYARGFDRGAELNITPRWGV